MQKWEVEREDSIEIVEAEDLREATDLAGTGWLAIRLYVDPKIEAERLAARNSGLTKLIALGLTEEEALALAGG